MLSDVLATLHELPTPLTEAFFSDRNIQLIQNAIIQQIKSRLGHTITNQNQDQVLIVMKFVYRDTPNNQYLDVSQQVESLNKRSIDVLVDLTITGLKQYLTYVRDASTLPQPLPLPLMTSVAGTKLYGLNTSGVYNGPSGYPTATPADRLLPY